MPGWDEALQRKAAVTRERGHFRSLQVRDMAEQTVAQDGAELG